MRLAIGPLDRHRLRDRAFDAIVANSRCFARRIPDFPQAVTSTNAQELDDGDRLDHTCS